MIINQANLQILFQAFKAAFNTGFRSQEAYWPKIATKVPSNTKVETYGWLGQFPRLREWIGDRQVKSLAMHSYQIQNRPFESTIGVPRDDIEDDTYGVFTPMFQEMGYAAATHPDELIFLEALAGGFTGLCYDGQPFFDADHPVGNDASGIESVSNFQDGGKEPWYLLDTRRPLKPFILQLRREYDFTMMTSRDDESVFMRSEYRYGIDARLNVGYGFWQTAFGSKDDLDQENFDAAVSAMLAFRSDEGRPLGIKPNLLVVGPSNRAAAKALIETERLEGGASNPNYKEVEVAVVPWLP